MSNGEKSATAKTLSLILTIKSLRNKIYVGKDIVRVLGAPRNVCVKINEDMSSLAIQPGDEKEYMSFKVPEKLFLSHKSEFTINSKSFVNDLLNANNLDPTKNHPIAGVYSEKTNSVIFKINPDTEN